MLNKELEEIKSELLAKADELAGLKAIYKDGITKNELRWVVVKSVAAGCVLGLLVGVIFL